MTTLSDTSSGQEPITEDTTGSTELEKAYIAGFFDAEGHFGVRSGLGCKGGQTFKVVVTQKDTAVLLWIQSFYGGGIYTHRDGSSQLEVTGQQGIAFLRDIMPYMRGRWSDASYFLFMFDNRFDRVRLQQLWEERPWKK